MVIKLCSERRGAHAHELVFVGPDADHPRAGWRARPRHRPVAGVWRGAGARSLSHAWERGGDLRGSEAVVARTPVTESGGSPMELEG